MKVEDYLMEELETRCNLATKEQLQNASERMSMLVHQLLDIPPCEGAAIGIGFSIKKNSEEIAKDYSLDCDTICNILFATVKRFSRPLNL